MNNNNNCIHYLDEAIRTQTHVLLDNEIIINVKYGCNVKFCLHWWLLNSEAVSELFTLLLHIFLTSSKKDKIAHKKMESWSNM